MFPKTARAKLFTFNPFCNILDFLFVNKYKLTSLGERPKYKRRQPYEKRKMTSGFKDANYLHLLVAVFTINCLRYRCHQMHCTSHLDACMSILVGNLKINCKYQVWSHVIEVSYNTHGGCVHFKNGMHCCSFFCH